MAENRPIYWPPLHTITEKAAENLENGAWKHWDEFYKQHQYSFFKDRHYLKREFPEILDGAPHILEVGCGVGNTSFPLLEVNPHAFVHACDFSPTAVECLRRHPAFHPARMQVFVADITHDRLAGEVGAGVIDICTMIFVLSAINPAKMKQAVLSVAETLKPGGLIFLRDYAVGDLAEGRLSQKDSLKCISPHFYVRGDGTRAFYFTEEGLRELFEGCGFCCKYVRTSVRDVENRGMEVTMNRRWIQAAFCLPGVSDKDAGATTTTSPQPEPGSGRPGKEGVTAAGEWEAEEQLHVVEGGLGNLFGCQAGEQVEETFEIPGAGNFVVRSLSREHRHTQAHTGLMLWEAAPAFARYLALSPLLLTGKTVLELGCGANPLCMLAALRHAARVVSTDGSPLALQSMAQNLSLNSSKVIIERARLRELAWGDNNQIAAVLGDNPGGFDMVFGTDVVYVEEFIALLLKTARKMLKPDSQARLVLCHITRRVAEGDICMAASHAGFSQCELPKAGPVDFLGGGAADASIRFLCFALACDNRPRI